MAWWERKAPESIGVALHAGAVPPRAEEFEGLERRDYAIERVEPGDDFHWKLELRHPRWGTAEFACPRRPRMPPPALAAVDRRLTIQAKEYVRNAQSVVLVRVAVDTQNVLTGKKRYLRHLHSALGDHGEVAFDVPAMSHWSRARLEDELAHDADVDIAALYALHAVWPRAEEGADEQTRYYWIHSHGLHALGLTDFDVLDPHADVAKNGDLQRSIAFAIAEGNLTPDGPNFDVFHPGGTVRLVGVERFAAATRGRYEEWRADLDDEHTRGHAVVCDPEASGLRRFLGRGPRTSRYLSAAQPDAGVFSFSKAATDLMAARAQGSYAVLCALAAEFESWGLSAMVKCGYEKDGDEGHEHLWFRAERFGEDRFDGVLLNEPFEIARMQAGQKDTHDRERITDWLIQTPFGSIDPRSLEAARRLRAGGDELRRLLVEHAQTGGG